MKSSFRGLLLVSIFALSFAASANIAGSVLASLDWSPVHTRSEPVPFAPDFFVQPSVQSRSNTLLRIEAIGALHARSRVTHAHTEGSIFSSKPKISSVANDDSQ
jgi:hypothetical protein